MVVSFHTWQQIHVMQGLDEHLTPHIRQFLLTLHSAQVFWAVFIPADSRAKSAQQLILTMLPFHPFIFHAAQVCLFGSVKCFMYAQCKPQF